MSDEREFCNICHMVIEGPFHSLPQDPNKKLHPYCYYKMQYETTQKELNRVKQAAVDAITFSDISKPMKEWLISTILRD